MPRKSRQQSLTAALLESALRRFSAVTWFYVAGALVLGWVVPHILSGPLVSVNAVLRPDQVIAFLSAVSSGMMAFTGIVFSLLFVVMQFGSSAYSPHLVALLARNRILVHAQGVFTGTFLYTLMALRAVRAAGNEGTTSLTLWIAFAWLIGSVYMLLRLVDVFAGLDITVVLGMLGDAGRREIAQMYGPHTSASAAPARPGRVTQTVAHAGAPGYLVRLDRARLVTLARAHDAVIRVPVSFGDSLSIGVTIAEVECSSGMLPEDDVRTAIVVARDRTAEAGPMHLIRLLVDIAIRALSPAVNDPTTAVNALDQIEDLLLRLGHSQLDVGAERDASGALRLVVAVPNWEEYLDIGTTEIQQYGADSVQVERRLGSLLATLWDRLPAQRRPALERALRERAAAVHHAFVKAPQREKAERADRQGLGHTVERPAELQ
jgi:uncharacterized membrane protein